MTQEQHDKMMAFLTDHGINPHREADALVDYLKSRGLAPADAATLLALTARAIVDGVEANDDSDADEPDDMVILHQPHETLQ